MKKLTGHLEEKNGKWYAAVNHYTTDGKRKVYRNADHYLACILDRLKVALSATAGNEKCTKNK